VITNSANNNADVTGFVNIAACTLHEGQTLSNPIDLTKLPVNLLIFDNGEYSTGALVQDVEPTVDVMAIVLYTAA
jgi:hypothetical protein